MKKSVVTMLVWIFIGFSHAQASLPKHAHINFTLSNIERSDSCPSLLTNANVVVEYDYNFERNIGLAYLKQLQSTSWVEALHPLGISNLYAFMSDMAPKVIHLNGGDVTVYRVIFDLYFNGDAKVILMIGDNGNCIMSSNTVNVNS